MSKTAVSTITQALRLHKKEVFFILTILIAGKGILFFVTWIYRNLSNASFGPFTIAPREDTVHEYLARAYKYMNN